MEGDGTATRSSASGPVTGPWPRGSPHNPCAPESEPGNPPLVGRDAPFPRTVQTQEPLAEKGDRRPRSCASASAKLSSPGRSCAFPRLLCLLTGWSLCFPPARPCGRLLAHCLVFADTSVSAPVHGLAQRFSRLPVAALLLLASCRVACPATEGGRYAERFQNFSCPKPEGLRQGRLAAARKRAPRSRGRQATGVSEKIGGTTRRSPNPPGSARAHTGLRHVSTPNTKKSESYIF